MKCLVTGAAGFIGSHLCDRLLREGFKVTGVDSFVPYYPRAVKESNLAGALTSPRFRFEDVDLRSADLDGLLKGVEVVFHLAAMPGLVKSWTDADLYESCNIAATRRLLDAAAGVPTLKRFVYASTSSVYGRYASGDEALPTRPISPYGVTKLAAEHLCRAYCEEAGLPVACLRYFSVFGPRQRPDMAYHKFAAAILTGRPITVYGDGQQIRGNTYVADCVNATVAAIGARTGEVYNVGGGESVTLREVVRKLEAITGRPAVIIEQPARKGDQRHTTADTTKLARHLGWRPTTGIDDGLAAQVEWHRRQLAAGAVERVAA